jgi:hypothetical protein
MRMVLALALTLVIADACGCKHSELDSFHSNWKKLPLSPLAGSLYLQQAEKSPCQWNVQDQGDRINIQRVSMGSLSRPDKLRVQFAGGTLLGEDRGDWGGSLSVLEDSNRTPREILSKNVLQMFPMQDGVEVITGDIPSNTGSAWLYSIAEGHGWSIQKKADLRGYPRVIGTSGDRMLFAYGDAVSIMENFSEHQSRLFPCLTFARTRSLRMQKVISTWA